MVFMPHWPQMIGSKPIDLGLDRIERVLEKLGNPQHALPPVVHVAGTNGKGSTLAFLRSFLEAAGYKVHVYTSPHLLDFNERIVVAGKHIDDYDLKQVMEECRIASEGIPVTFFEGTTAGAFLAFSKVDADIVLLETGLGGRLDATNVVAKPALTVITPISLDHMEYLGPTVELIAGEKAGILKQQVPCVVSKQHEAADQVLQRKAAELEVPLYMFEYDWVVDKKSTTMAYQSQKGDMELPLPALPGDHQILNAATAIACTQMLENFSISKDALFRGVLDVKWPARLEHITSSPLLKMLPEGSELWLDGAHNEAGAFALAQSLEDFSAMPLIIVCGFTKGRDPKKLLQYFKGKADKIYGTLVRTEPSALPGEEVAQAAKTLGFDAEGFDSVDEAVYKAGLCAEGPVRVLCMGSLYLASDVKSESVGQTLPSFA